MRRPLHALPIVALLLLGASLRVSLPSKAAAQVLGPPLERGDLEVGYTYKWFHRDMEPFAPTEMRWEVGAFFLRYGAFGRLTFSIEGNISNVEHEDLPGLDYRRYTVGAGAAVKLLERGRWLAAASYHYNEVWDHDDSPNAFHKRTLGTITGVVIGRSLDVRRQALVLWAGPVYVEDVGENYPWNATRPLRNESSDNFGVAAGARVVLFDRLSGGVWAVHADYVQVRLLVSVLFRAGSGAGSGTGSGAGSGGGS